MGLGKRPRILVIAGARPNFMKVAPILRVMRCRDRFETVLVHTGQHYDAKMSDVFFNDLQIPPPDIHLEVGSGSHAEQTALVMTKFEKVVMDRRPDSVLVVGDVNSTLACSVTSAKLCVPVAHVEAGLRSGDRTMPEEINRIVTDALSDYLFTTEPSGSQNLLKEGKRTDQIHFCGNVMIDSLVFSSDRIKNSTVLRDLQLKNNGYILVTLHRPSNVDNADALRSIVHWLDKLQKKAPVVFPTHPRTRKMFEHHGLQSEIKKLAGLQMIDPVGYIDFVRLMQGARCVVTDSGGIQEETTFMGIPCLTMRDNTERPVTIDSGTNTLIGHDSDRLLSEIEMIFAGRYKKGGIPELWDGKAAERITDVFEKVLL